MVGLPFTMTRHDLDCIADVRPARNSRFDIRCPHRAYFAPSSADKFNILPLSLEDWREAPLLRDVLRNSHDKYYNYWAASTLWLLAVPTPTTWSLSLVWESLSASDFKQVGWAPTRRNQDWPYQHLPEIRTLHRDRLSALHTPPFILHHIDTPHISLSWKGTTPRFSTPIPHSVRGELHMIARINGAAEPDRFAALLGARQYPATLRLDPAKSHVRASLHLFQAHDTPIPPDNTAITFVADTEESTC